MASVARGRWAQRGVASVATNAGPWPTVLAASIGSGVRWTTRSASGHEASIPGHPVLPSRCCIATPDLTTRADDYRDDNLEKLPRCGEALNGWTDTQRVTLRIDTSRALRSHHSHVELVESIIGAPPSPRRADRGGAW